MNYILSFDVGIVHLAYCLFTKKDNNILKFLVLGDGKNSINFNEIKPEVSNYY